MTGSGDSYALYLYGFVPADAAAPRIAGVGAAPVETLAMDGITAVIGRVPTAEYGQPALAERLGDVRWVAEQGALHERVVAWFVDHAQILPARLLTLYSSERALREAVAERRGHIEAGLRRFASLREWDLKVAFDPDRLADRLPDLSPELLALDAAIAGAAPGRSYLLRRKRADLARSEAAAAARRLAASVLADAEALAAETRSVPLAGPAAATPDSLPVVLAAALLVQEDSEERILHAVRARAEELRDYGLDVRFTGPWAPYRFIDDERVDGTDGG